MEDAKQQKDTTTAAMGCFGSVAAVRMRDHGTKKAVSLLVVVGTVQSDRSSSRLQWNSGADDSQGWWRRTRGTPFIMSVGQASEHRGSWDGKDAGAGAVATTATVPSQCMGQDGAYVWVLSSSLGLVVDAGNRIG